LGLFDGSLAAVVAMVAPLTLRTGSGFLYHANAEALELSPRRAVPGLVRSENPLYRKWPPAYRSRS
jgi:hypothetical protein